MLMTLYDAGSALSASSERAASERRPAQPRTIMPVDAESMLAYCLTRPGAWPDNPWDHEHPVVKVGAAGKIFAFVGATGVGVKCGADREEADLWLVRYPDAAAPMPYLARSGWNTLSYGINDDELIEAVADSYARVVAKLPKHQQPQGWSG